MEAAENLSAVIRRRPEWQRVNVGAEESLSRMPGPGDTLPFDAITRTPSQKKKPNEPVRKNQSGR
jgi:hypothetical protein